MTRLSKTERKGISILELSQMFPDEDAAIAWFEKVLWEKGGRYCPHCGSTNTADKPNKKPQPYRCRDCKKFFSLKTGTVMNNSNLPVRKWVFAIYLISTSLKGVSSMKLHRDLDISQKHAWHLAQRIREAFNINANKLSGEVEADETFIGGKVGNMSKKKRMKMGKNDNKVAVLGMKERGGRIIAKPVISTGARALQPEVIANVEKGSTLYTDENPSYKKLGSVYRHKSVNHSAWEYVKKEAHTNGIESFWALLKRGYHGTYHKMSAKHLHRYVNEFAARHNDRRSATLAQMQFIAKGLTGKKLTYKTLIK